MEEGIPRVFEANKEALEFLKSIDIKSLSRTVFKDALATVSDAGKEIGELTVSVEETIRGGEICFLVHAQSHGQVDNVPCGTSVTAYIGRGVKTLEQTQHEYIKIPDNQLDKKTILLKEGEEYLVRMTTTEGTTVTEKEKIYPEAAMKGFVSEGANIILQRIMACRQEVPENGVFLALESNLEIASSSYHKTPDCSQQVGNESIMVLGIERQIHAVEQLVWRSHFLTDGHLSSRQTVGSPVRMQLVTMPESEKEEEKLQLPPPKDLHWKEDMELMSHFLDRREELINNHKDYFRNKPEIRALIADFCQFVLLRKPDDICRFASEYFAPMSTRKIIKAPPQTST